MFREVRDRIPSMAAWMESCYMDQPFLRLGEHTILSSCGVQQGDPLGPLGFALILQPIIEKIKEEVPNLLINAWYLDDGTLCGSASDLCAALAINQSQPPPSGHPYHQRGVRPPGLPHRPCLSLRVNRAQKGKEGARDSSLSSETSRIRKWRLPSFDPVSLFPK